MNTYELADEYKYTKKEHDAFMENPTDANRISVLCKRDEFLQKLIRQQADRIALLESDRNRTIKALREKVAELEKQSEPVGWYKKDSNDYFIENVGFPDFQVQEYIDAGYIPLYTTPHHASDVKQTKPLSDEEIKELAEKYLAGFSEYNCCNTHVEGEIEFARAIEAKVRGQ